MTSEMTRCLRDAMAISGSSASSGKERIRSTEDFTSARTRSGSASISSSMATVPTPSDAPEVTRLTPSIPRTASSTASTIPCSTSSGEAPG